MVHDITKLLLKVALNTTPMSPLIGMFFKSSKVYHATNTLNSVLSQMEYIGSKVKHIGRGVQLGLWLPREIYAYSYTFPRYTDILIYCTGKKPRHISIQKHIPMRLLLVFTFPLSLLIQNNDPNIYVSQTYGTYLFIYM